MSDHLGDVTSEDLYCAAAPALLSEKALPHLHDISKGWGEGSDTIFFQTRLPTVWLRLLRALHDEENVSSDPLQSWCG